MKVTKIFTKPVITISCIVASLVFFAYTHSQAIDSMTNPNWYITIWDSGYSDWIISPHQHEQLSGEWAAAILYDEISNGEAMWLERYWVCPDWESNSQFQVVTPFHAWDDPTNPVVGNDTGQSIISNGQVEITIDCTMQDGRTIGGLTPGVAEPDHILSHHYIMLQTYTIKNITQESLNNVSLFQLMHAQPNDDYGPNNYAVYDPTIYVDPEEGFPGYHYDMTFFAPDANWYEFMDDAIGFSSTIQPNAWGLGEFPSDFCGGGEPGPTSLHHLVEANALLFGSVAGPLEIAGAMRWDLGAIEPNEVVHHTVLLWTGHSPAGLPPSPGLIILEPELITNEVGSTHSITATVTLDGEPVPGINLSFEVVDGPHKYTAGTYVTDENGVANFSYVGTAEGKDLIQASGDTNEDGILEKSNLATKEWVITNSPPVADPNGPYHASADSCITLDGTGSYDPDAARGDTISYAWDLDNDGVFDDSSIDKPEFCVGSVIGMVYDICLKIVDNFGATGIECTTVDVLVGPVICGDFDHDDDVDMDDYNEFLSCFGSSPGDPNWNAEADLFDGDGLIALPDFAAWYQCYMDYISGP